MKDYQQTSTLQQQTLGTSRKAQSSPFTLHGARSGVAVVCHAPRAASFAVVAVNPRRQVATVAKIATDRGGNVFQQSTTNQPMFNQHHKQCTTHNKTHNVRRLLNLPRGPSADRFIAAALNAQCTTNDLHNVSMMQRQSQPDTWLLADRFIDQCCNAQPTNACSTQCKMQSHDTGWPCLRSPAQDPPELPCAR